MSRSGSSVVTELNQISGTRQNFENYWQTLHDYFYTDSSNITVSKSPGEELDHFYLYDNTTLESADVLASGMSNYLTPYSSKWIRLRPLNQQLLADKEVMDWMQNVEDEVSYILSSSNFYTQMPSFWKGSGVYGTSSLMYEKDPDTLIRFHHMPVKHVYICDDHRGKPYKYFITLEYTAEQAKIKFGEENLSQDLKDKMENKSGKTKTFDFIYYIGPRENIDYNKQDSKNMPIEALWIEKDSQHVVKEEGFTAMPMVSHRFEKRPFIPYGYSPAMKSLPMARMLNAIAETTLRSAMKQTDPPIAMPHNAFLAPLNANPRAINYYKQGIKPGEDIGPIANYGNPMVGQSEIEYYSRQIKQTMFNDVFVAFEDLTKRMTVPEVMERINEKMTLLGPSVGRAMSDVLTPIVERVVAMAYEVGRLPRMPDKLLQDPNYKIVFVGKLSQAQKQSQLQAFDQALARAGQLAEFKPEVLDKINGDKAIDEVWEITAAPAATLNDEQTVIQIREQRMQQQQEAMQIEAAERGANIGETLSRAKKNNQEG